MEQPAAGDGAQQQQRQKKSSAAKKAKKGGATGSGNGGAWPAIKPKKDLQVNRLKGTQLLTVSQSIPLLDLTQLAWDLVTRPHLGIR